MKKKKRIYRILLSFLLAAAAFVGLLLFEKSRETPVITKEVVCALKDVPEGTEFTKDNLTAYFKISSVDETYLGNNPGILKVEELTGMVSKVALKAGTILQKDWFLNQKAMEAMMVEPVRLSLKAEDLSRMVGGTLRAGDFADFYFYEEETRQASLCFKGVYVDEALDSSGQPVQRGEKERVASMITILLEEQDVEAFCEHLNHGEIYAAKCEKRETVYEKIEEEIQITEGESHAETNTQAKKEAQSDSVDSSGAGDIDTAAVQSEN